MPSKPEVLEKLKKGELLSAVDRFELEVADRRVRGDLVEALAGSRKASLSEILGELPRTRLKEICRKLYLDDSGREKSVLIERLTGKAASPKPEPPPAPVTRKAQPSPAPLPVMASGQLTREALERHIWSAADILRGSIDSSDYKNYILGLLFLKRLSDRFEEECEIVRAQSRDPEDPDEHQFYVPPAARWERLRKVATNFGEELNKASADLEEKNPRLEGVLNGIDFNDERKLGDSKQRDQVLGNLVLHFSGIDLRNANLSEPDMLGRAYEYLIERFADDAGKKGGEFYTPHQVVRLIVEILQPREGMRICDPTCGSGGMLIQCAQYVQRNGGDPRNLSLFGQEKNLGTWAICKMNMLLHGLPDARIEKGDTIREPKLLEDGSLMQFDLVIANPPFSLENWGREVAEKDSWRRFRFGLPPKSAGDLAFLQHMVATLNNCGRMAVVMPRGVLFRASERGIRRKLIEEDLVEAVVGLPQNLFYGTGIPASIIVINRAKDKIRRGNILFVDASRNFTPGTNQSQLRAEDINKIAQSLHQHLEQEYYSKAVSIADIDDYNLSVSLYVDSVILEENSDLSTCIRNLREAEIERERVRARLDLFLGELGHAKS